MKTYIALFRGINVGGKNKITMKSLASHMNNCGFENIQTYIQSGNVVFNSKSVPSESVAQSIEAEYGFKPEVMFLKADEIQNIEKNNPYKDIEAKSCHFYFCKDKPKKADLEKLDQLIANGEDYTLDNKVLYLKAPNGIGRSKLAANIEKCLGVSTTARNLNTVKKIIKLCAEHL